MIDFGITYFESIVEFDIYIMKIVNVFSLSYTKNMLFWPYKC